MSSMNEVFKKLATRESNKLFDPEAPRKTEGYESLISEKEYEAVQHLVHAFDNFVKVHNECACEVDFRGATPYQKIQYAIFSDCVYDLIDPLTKLQSIHTLDKDMIDSMCAEDNQSVAEYEADLSKSLFVKRITQMFG